MAEQKERKFLRFVNFELFAPQYQRSTLYSIHTQYICLDHTAICRAVVLKMWSWTSRISVT